MISRSASTPALWPNVRGMPRFLRPAPVAIHNDRHVARQKFLQAPSPSSPLRLFLHFGQELPFLSSRGHPSAACHRSVFLDIQRRASQSAAPTKPAVSVCLRLRIGNRVKKSCGNELFSVVRCENDAQCSAILLFAARRAGHANLRRNACLAQNRLSLLQRKPRAAAFSFDLHDLLFLLRVDLVDVLDRRVGQLLISSSASSATSSVISLFFCFFT